ncbi:MAG: cation transporter [Nitrospirae bacterium]|nr:cation transporter [Nitrospirota bacterium]
MMETFTRAPLLLAVLTFLFFFTGGPTTDSSSRAEGISVLQTVILKIDGMDCGACAKDIRSALLKTPGVQAAEVKTSKRWIFFNDYSNARAVVEYEQGKTTVDELIKAVEGASNSIFTYKARLAE